MRDEQRDVSSCRICDAPTRVIGTKNGAIDQRTYELRQCPSCWYAFVANPWLDYPSIYNESYYRGDGADPYVGYLQEVEGFEQTIRQYEWRGLLAWASSQCAITDETSWLDYGCGTGGFVTYLQRHGVPRAEGLEQGWAAGFLREHAVPTIDDVQLSEDERRYDVITAIEVLEHTVDPLGELERLRTALKPGGLLLLTTGNAAPYRDKITKWRYVNPDIHLSFFEPTTLQLALERTGFDVVPGRFGPGWEDIIRYKVLKRLRRQRIGALERVAPWGLVARVVDRRLGLSAQPVGRLTEVATASD